MTTDYRKFGTPYFEIEVGDPNGKRMVKLPHHILRLVQKVEISESMEEGYLSGIVLTILEGSREPASTDPMLSTDGLYKLDMDIAGSLTNRSGIITDLRFSGNNGITFITATEEKNKAVSNTIQKNIKGKNVTRKHVAEKKEPLFLFEANNRVKVTWGYKEAPNLTRSIICRVAVLKSDFSESDMVKTTIVCQPTKEMMDKISPTKGTPFGTSEKTKNGYLVNIKDVGTEKVLRSLANKMGVKAIFSDNLPISTIDNNHQKIWLPGKSFKQYMDELARTHNCIWDFIPNPNTGQDTLIFIKRQDYESKTILTDPNLLRYKYPGSILKSVTINADFYAAGGYGQLGTDQNGDSKSEITTDGEVQLQLYQAKNNGSSKKEQLIDLDGKKVDSFKSLAENVLGDEYTGRAEYNPTTTSGENKRESANISATDNSRIVQLSFKTIGYTKLIPGVVEIGGIGVRYSGKYRVLNVKHSIDSNGYITECTATTYALPYGGVEVKEAKQGQEVEPKVGIKLYKAAEGSASIVDAVKKFRGVED